MAGWNLYIQRSWAFGYQLPDAFTSCLDGFPGATQVGLCDTEHWISWTFLGLIMRGSYAMRKGETFCSLFYTMHNFKNLCHYSPWMLLYI